MITYHTMVLEYHWYHGTTGTMVRTRVRTNKTLSQNQVCRRNLPWYSSTYHTMVWYHLVLEYSVPPSLVVENDQVWLFGPRHKYCHSETTKLGCFSDLLRASILKN